MTDTPTEADSRQEDAYRGAERRRDDRRVGERRVTERRRSVDLPDKEASGERGNGSEARERDGTRFWYDFMRFNLTGWSVVVPTLAGLAIGNWIDNRYPASFSWALALMVAGLFLGCLNAWYWIRHRDDGGRR